MDTYNINGVAVKYDTFDTVNMELFINELERMQKETEALPKDVTAYMKGMCELVRDFFDTIIGEGTSDKCFGPRSNLKAIVFAYGDFVRRVAEEMASITDIMGSNAIKYGSEPAPTNREQRRAEERARRRAEAAERVKLRKSDAN